MARRKEPGCLAHHFFTWVVPIAVKGYKQPLGPDDVPPVPKSMSAANSCQRADALWQKELAQGKEKASLWRVLWQMQKWRIVLGLSYSVLQGLVTTIARPLLLRAVIVQALSTSAVVDSLHLLIIFALSIFLEGFLQSNS